MSYYQNGHKRVLLERTNQNKMARLVSVIVIRYLPPKVGLQIIQSKFVKILLRTVVPIAMHYVAKQL